MTRIKRQAGASTFEYRDEKLTVRAIVACDEQIVEAFATIDLVPF